MDDGDAVLIEGIQVNYHGHVGASGSKGNVRQYAGAGAEDHDGSQPCGFLDQRRDQRGHLLKAGPWLQQGSEQLVAHVHGCLSRRQATADNGQCGDGKMEGSMRHIGKSIPQKIQATRVFQQWRGVWLVTAVARTETGQPQPHAQAGHRRPRRHAGTQHRVAHRAGAVHQASVKTLDSQAAVIERAGDVFRREVL
jgi:hypothetical protein